MPTPIDVVAIEPVISPDVDGRWPSVATYVARAVVHSASPEPVESWRASCRDGRRQLWVITKNECTIGVVITEIYETQRGLTCALPIAAADNLAEAITAVSELIEAWARAEGCVRLEGWGRPGWSRQLRQLGWTPYAVQIEKSLT